mgnify:FL=1
MCDVPVLRFPEFSGEWETVKIGTITTKVGSGVTPRGGETVYHSQGHPFVRSQNVGWGRLLLNDIAYIDEETHKKQLNTALELNDILLNITGASIGRCAVVNKMIVNGNVNQHVCIIRSNGAVDPKFLCNYLLSNYGQKQIDSFQAGGNRQGLNFEQIKSIRISIPTLDEQKYIAKLLCAINQRIETQNKIIEKLETLIKGIRNNIISKIKGDCIVLQDIADIYQPQTIASTDLTEDGYLVYGANGIIGKYHSFNHEKEQICITCRGNTCGTVNFTEPKSWITGNAMVINTDNYAKNVNKRYLFHYLSSINFNSIISGSGQPQIVRQPLAKLKLILPVLIIQNCTAESLDAMFAKMKNEQSFLQILQIQKSCLLSQMFT